MRPHRLAIFGCLGLLLSGCTGWQSALDPQGPQARHLATLIWSFTAVCTLVWLLVMVVLAIALSRPVETRADPLAIHVHRERRSSRVVAAAVVATTLIVLALTGLSYFSQKKLFAPASSGVTIRITGHQWWWEVRYQDPRPDRTFTTANEIHIPVGTPVTVKLTSSDVIHSFWVPSLAGKMDLIPGQENELHFVAARPGIYRGQCAEFCGFQHAHMAVFVIAEAEEEFGRWRDRQIKPAEPPENPEQRKGQEAFLSKPCVMCHSVRGTPAGGKVAPDLTHVGSRRYLAAGVLPMSRGNLAAWIVDPHGIKPGVNMPTVKLDPDDLNAIAGYLEGLR